MHAIGWVSVGDLISDAAKVGVTYAISVLTSSAGFSRSAIWLPVTVYDHVI